MPDGAGICAGRTIIVTGAGRGMGRCHALEAARQGANVVVNDLGANVDGTGASSSEADGVVDEVRACGGQAIANYEDISSWDGAKRLVESAVAHFGDLHAVVNNAGILRDRMLVNMSFEEWDSVLRVHLNGTFAVSRHAAAYWRDQAKANGAPVDARIINTSSSSGLYGNVGQANYGAAKAAIASFTLIAAEELARYGITVNAIAPYAITRMSSDASRARAAADTSNFSEHDPENVSPLVVWLASNQSRAVSGRVFNVRGGYINVAEGWSAGPETDKGARWDPAELGEVVAKLVQQAAPNANAYGYRPQQQTKG